MSASRVVITGLGAVSPLGLTAQEMWEGLSTGRSGIGPIQAFNPAGLPCRIGGEVPEYRIQNYVPKTYRKALKLLCRDIELAVIAAREAIAASGLVTKSIDPDNVTIDPTRTAVNIGSGMISCSLPELGPAVAASITDGRFDIRKWGAEGLELITPLWLLKYLPNMLACHIAILHDIEGPSNTLACAEASGQLAIGEAAQVVARGDSDVAVAGAAESKVNSLLMVRQCLLKRAVADWDGPPEEACRPFDADARGAVFGEGGGMVVLETLEHARSRGARILAEVAGIGQSHNLNPVYERLEPDGEGLRIAIEKALADAEIEPGELDLLIPHGTGVPEDDLAEAHAIEAALGEAARTVTVWPTKSMLSTAGAAGGALDVVATVQAMTAGVIPAARNFSRPADGVHLNIGTSPREGGIRHALCCSYTYGGQVAAVVLKAYDGSESQ